MPHRNSNGQQGFTIVEVLVAIVLLTVIVLAVLTPLTGFFGLTRRSNVQTGATQNVQRTVEVIRGEWLNATRYEQACWSGNLPNVNLQIQITNLDPNGVATGSPVRSGDAKTWNCSTAIPNDKAPLRRIQVTQLDAQNTPLTSMTVEIAHP